MILKNAKILRDLIREDGTHCIVPLGHGPRGYFCRIFTTDGGPREFKHLREWRAYRKESQLKRMRAKLLSRPRSPIEMMIDRACGIEG